MENLRLDTENYFLQSLNESDVSERYLSWLHDFEVSKTLEVDGKSQTLETIKDYINWHDNKLKFLFGIFGTDTANFSCKIADKSLKKDMLKEYNELKKDYELFIKNRKDEDEANYKI